MVWLLYGVTGYTGTLILERALAQGSKPILGGRQAPKVLELAEQHGLEARVFDFKDEAFIERQLQGIEAVLHCAGPFSETALPMLKGCLKTGTHYLDITGEIDVFERIFSYHDQLLAKKITAIPGVGFDVVPTDCLAAMLKKRLPDAVDLILAFAPRGEGTLSPGTAKTMIEGFGEGGKLRRAGRIISVPFAAKERQIPFPGGSKSAVTIPWGDIATAYRSTGIENIEVYTAAPRAAVRAMKLMAMAKPLFKFKGVQALLKQQVPRFVHGPSPEKRERSSTELWGQVKNKSGVTVELAMRTPEGYHFTAVAALAALDKVLAGRTPTGALTPSLAFGADFVKELEGVQMLA